MYTFYKISVLFENKFTDRNDELQM